MVRKVIAVACTERAHAHSRPPVHTPCTITIRNMHTHTHKDLAHTHTQRERATQTDRQTMHAPTGMCLVLSRMRTCTHSNTHTDNVRTHWDVPCPEQDERHSRLPLVEVAHNHRPPKPVRDLVRVCVRT